MLVIHPSDRTTDFLRTLYEGREDVRLLTGKESRKELGSILFHLRPGERVMLLGHGTDAQEYGIACSPRGDGHCPHATDPVQLR